MWLRDAVRFELLPTRASQAALAVFALSIRIGDVGVSGRTLRRSHHGGRSDGAGAGTLEKRIHKVTGVELEQLFADWRATVYDTYGPQPAAGPGDDPSPLVRDAKAGRMQLGPSLSPDGREAVFFSERDRLSLDLFLADTTTGAITRKLATTTATARFESLQADSIRGLVESGRRSIRLCRHRARPACARHSGCVPVWPRSADRASATGTGADAGVVSRRPLDRVFRAHGGRDGLVCLRSRCRTRCGSSRTISFRTCSLCGRRTGARSRSSRIVIRPISPR